MMNINAAVPQSHHGLLIKLLFVASYINAINASNFLNPISVGIRSAIGAPRITDHVSRSASGRKYEKYQQNYNEDIAVNPDNFNGRSRRNSHGLMNTLLVSNTKPAKQVKESKMSRGGGATQALSFYENMICGAVSRSIAQVATHPANTMKTLLQSNRGSADPITIKMLAKPENMKMLTRGAGAQFIMSIPHGAVNFAVLEYVRKRMLNLAMRSTWASEMSEKSGAFGPVLDFCSSAIATVCCSVVSTPQMMVVDNIMAGTYSNFPNALIGLTKDKGIAGFYSGWWPGLVGKIPSYALTWTLFQQLKLAQLRICNRPPRDFENSIMGCMASTTTVCVMIPMDTIKTRLVTQMNYPDLVPYKGIIDCAKRIAKEEGFRTFYRGLPPRLISVVPMIGIQFGVYEFMKKVMIDKRNGVIDMREQHKLEEIVMEVSAHDDQPSPAPHIVESSKQHKN